MQAHVAGYAGQSEVTRLKALPGSLPGSWSVRSRGEEGVRQGLRVGIRGGDALSPTLSLSPSPWKS